MKPLLFTLSLLILLFGTSSTCHAQSSGVQDLLDQAIEYPDARQNLLIDAKKLALENNDMLGLGEVYYQTGLHYESLGVPELSVEEYEQARELFHKQQADSRYRETTLKLKNAYLTLGWNNKAEQLEVEEVQDKKIVVKLSTQQIITGILLVISLLAVFYFRRQWKRTIEQQEEKG